MRHWGIAFALTLVFGPAVLSAAESTDEARRAHAEQLEQWRAWRFGMFIHWGPSSLTGNEISWSRGR